MDAIALLEIANDTEFSLVSAMGAKGPMVRHVNKTHPLQGKQLPIIGIR
jgi:hypothetical protein